MKRPVKVPVIVAVVAAVLVLGAAGAGILAFRSSHGERAETFADPIEHFKYGSIGSERGFGVPYAIWRVMPTVCSRLMPQFVGRTGWENFGFLYESKDKARPIGTSLRDLPLPTIGLNCAVCHSGSVRDQAAGPRRIVLGMPAHAFDFGGYQRFLFHCAADERFNARTILAAIEKDDPRFDRSDRARFEARVIPETKAALARLAAARAWQEIRTDQGPGRADIFNHYKVHFKMDIEHDVTVGTADFPAIWNQPRRGGASLLWDGANASVEESAASTAIAVGGTIETLDPVAVERVVQWMSTLPAARMPADRIDAVAAARGKSIYERECAGCHEPGEPQSPRVTTLDLIATDPLRLESLTPELIERLDGLPAQAPVRFSHFAKTNGYADVPLDGLWLRAPYLHNGSVANLDELLKKPSSRARQFFRGIDIYDYKKVGFVSNGDIEIQMRGTLFATESRGNSAAGHAYGSGLPDAEKDDLIEFLKTL